MRPDAAAACRRFAGAAFLIMAVNLVHFLECSAGAAFSGVDPTVERKIAQSATTNHAAFAAAGEAGIPTAHRVRSSVREPRPAGPRVEEDSQKLPRVAIIIDDMGYQQRIGEALLDLDMNLTFSFLPAGPFTPAQQERAWREGHDVLLHIPMEPHDPSSDAGPDTLLVADPPEAIAGKTQRHLVAVPRAVGVNNHMGSRFTEDPAVMGLFLQQIAKRGLFFVDSGTSSRSIAMETARAMGMQTARRDVFLDNVEDGGEICLQLQVLVEHAVRHGGSIGIGHPGETTLAALTGCGEMLAGRVRVVGIRELVR